MTADQLRELQDRGRFFYERFPGAAAAEEWKRFRDAGEQEQTDASESPAHASDTASTIRTVPGTR
jgi:hypothetical protein